AACEVTAERAAIEGEPDGHAVWREGAGAGRQLARIPLRAARRIAKQVGVGTDVSDGVDEGHTRRRWWEGGVIVIEALPDRIEAGLEQLVVGRVVGGRALRIVAVAEA